MTGEPGPGGRQSAPLGRRAGPALAVALLAVAGCGAWDDVGPTPAGVTTEIRQSRSEWAARVVDVRVVNAGPQPVEVRTATLTTSTAVGSATSDPARGRAVPAGRTRDFSVPLGPPRCRRGDETGRRRVDEPPSVRLELVDAAEGVTTVATTPADPQGHLARVLAEDCAGAAALAAADLRLGHRVAVSEDDAGAVVGHLTLMVRPVAGAPGLTVDRIDGTVLIDPVGGPSWHPAELSLPLTGPVSVDLPFTAARCDPHAVAEDKRGTHLAVHARLDGRPLHAFYLGADEDLRGQVHDLVALACGWP